MDYVRTTQAIVAIVKDTAVFINQELGRVTTDQIEVKDRNSLVSYVDKTAERMLVKELHRLLPDAAFITEEETIANNLNAYRTWIIDPLDGTSNFLHNIPHFSISVALKEGNQIVCGVILSVVSGEIFHASKGGGAFLHETRLSVSQTTSVDNALIATGFPYKVSDVAPLIRTLGYFMRHARGIRRLGSAALDLAYVAAGRFDCYYETTLNAWDVAAGVLIIEESGGRVSSFDNGEDYLFGGRIIGTNGRIHDDIVRIISANFI